MARTKTEAKAAGFEKTLYYELVFTDPVLGACPADKDIYRTFLGTKAPDAQSLEEEVAALGADAVADKKMTVFLRDEDGKPCVSAHTITGLIKGQVAYLRRVPGSVASKTTAYQKKINGNVFPGPRLIPFRNCGVDVGNCQRPLRATTPQGERVSLAMSEEIPAGASIRFWITITAPELEDLIKEALDYGKNTGFGQWRNSGKGRFLWKQLDPENGAVIGGNWTPDFALDKTPDWFNQ